MEVYTNENEQVDVIRRFFANNGKALVFGLVLGAGALIGWRYWQSHQTNKLQESAEAFERVDQGLIVSTKESHAAAEKFASETNNSYGVMMHMHLAQLAVEKNELTKADQFLSAATDQVKNEDLLSLVNIRLARVQLAEDKADAALKTLEQVKGSGWVAVAEDIRGDALLKKGDIAGARAAYTKGLSSNSPQAIKSMLNLKLNNLSS
ncbi:tetratricopeptide repeat protein [Photorhabdus bodei]|uniref:Ancillary SecYEG translocon subunit n=1 Tax=Photorhabdus bodei TaxID=2029681 RepID=A0ABX0AJI5_9GAMM|nr:tetratricopeptide repeat protein [Photorhabdus bodei]NDL03176.1 tetratricopeptide repeat protein [Photorhabdus bodei]NDL07290.1 tetratricopeptide repeat protein [Photorhabdus bodei]